MMKPYDTNKLKGEFFKVLSQTSDSQIAVMTLQGGEKSGGLEKHTGDQTVYVIEGEGIVIIGDEELLVHSGHVITIPARSNHQIINNAKEELFLLSVYSPPVY